MTTPKIMIEACMVNSRLYFAPSISPMNGAGVPGAFPPLAGSEWVNGDPKTLALIPLLGITGSITVAGKSYTGTMPPFGTMLSDAELAAVLSHIRSSFGNHAPPVNPELVKSDRERYASRTQPWAGGDELKAQH